MLTTPISNFHPGKVSGYDESGPTKLMATAQARDHFWSAGAFSKEALIGSLMVVHNLWLNILSTPLKVGAFTLGQVGYRPREGNSKPWNEWITLKRSTTGAQTEFPDFEPLWIHERLVGVTCSVEGNLG